MCIIDTFNGFHVESLPIITLSLSSFLCDSELPILYTCIITCWPFTPQTPLKWSVIYIQYQYRYCFIEDFSSHWLDSNKVCSTGIFQKIWLPSFTPNLVILGRTGKNCHVFRLKGCQNPIERERIEHKLEARFGLSKKSPKQPFVWWYSWVWIFLNSLGSDFELLLRKGKTAEGSKCAIFQQCYLCNMRTRNTSPEKFTNCMPSQKFQVCAVGNSIKVLNAGSGSLIRCSTNTSML